MTKTVINTINLSKRYRLGLKEKQSKTLAGKVTNLIKSPWQNLKRLQEMSRFGVEDESVFWALKDINFEVKEGEVLGIIGKNGAGKSTLLKILSQITDPTSGRIEIQGRVASLLEVGTGFHPELSGRENIYMNGTILGMTRREIDAKLDEIIDFSGVEKFIDTPVKFYSSGMKVRLGFSVAAHLEPEILIIDEVLAVGDYEFQQKCLGKMEDVSKNQGRTVLFVSHNMAAVQHLCPQALLLRDGKLVKRGETLDVFETYLNKIEASNQLNLEQAGIKGEGNQNIVLKEIAIHGDKQKGSAVCAGQDFSIALHYSVAEDCAVEKARIDIRIDNSLNQRLLWFSSKREDFIDLAKGHLAFSIPSCPLVPDEYLLTVFITDGTDIANWYPQVMRFRVEEAQYFSNGLEIPKGQSHIIYPYQLR